ncbi:hypothetical protein H4582DRAFT_2129443 [Lactarius indigo]|nr:hypothetical protein H4582DRAFT_2129443 [Lactarius indigo]
MTQCIRIYVSGSIGKGKGKGAVCRTAHLPHRLHRNNFSFTWWNNRRGHYLKARPTVKLRRRITRSESARRLYAIHEWIGGSLLRLEPSRLEPFLLTVRRSSQSVTGKPHLPTIQCLAPPSHVRSHLLTTEDAETSTAAAAADVSLLFGSATGSDVVYDRRMQQGEATQRGTGSAANANGGPARLRRNAEYSSGTLAADQGVLRAAEEKVGEDLDVMKQKHVQLWDYHGKALGTTCLTISGVVVVAIEFLVIFMSLVCMRGHGR